MKSHYKKSSPPFITIARNRRGDAVFKLKKGIERDRAIFGGRFTSELHWNESHEDRQWFDFYFFGADRFTIWNAQITTARREFWYEVDELAFAHTAKLITATARSQISSFEHRNARRSRSEKIQSYEWILKEEPRFAELGKKPSVNMPQVSQTRLPRTLPRIFGSRFKSIRVTASVLGYQSSLIAPSLTKR
ncbi:hypothetical protein [Herbaspirillum seropedicae]|uniref:hypothetical protein n=1 Tax=Herbaspirillum seropedicae TaxID=964 RepID=UPI003D96A0E5